jgi:hypothetical protein
MVLPTAKAAVTAEMGDIRVDRCMLLLARRS